MSLMHSILKKNLNENSFNEEVKILDIGCGNGIMMHLE